MEANTELIFGYNTIIPKELLPDTIFYENSVAKTQFLLLAREVGLPVEVVCQGERLSRLHTPALQPLGQHILWYLEAPTILFSQETDHAMRRNFATYLERRSAPVYAWYETNRLRYNQLYSLSFLPLIHKKVLESLPVVKHLLTDAVKEIPESGEMYELLHVSKRLNITENLATGLKRVFTELQLVDIHGSDRRGDVFQ